MHSLVKSMDDLKQTLVAAREARLCRYRERCQKLVTYLLTQSRPPRIAKVREIYSYNCACIVIMSNYISNCIKLYVIDI